MNIANIPTFPHLSIWFTSFICHLQNLFVKYLEEMKKKLSKDEAILCQKEGNYFMLRDFPNIFNISERALNSLKSLVMQKFFQDKLYYPLRSYHGIELNHSPSWVELNPETFFSFLIEFHKPKIRRQDLCHKDWGFYEQFLNPDEPTSFENLYIPHLAVHMEDLRKACDQKKLNDCLNILDLIWTGREKQKNNTVKRDKKIWDYYLEFRKDEKNKNISDQDVVKEIHEKIKKEKTINLLSRETIRDIIISYRSDQVNIFIKKYRNNFHHMKTDIIFYIENYNNKENKNLYITPQLKKIAGQIIKEHEGQFDLKLTEEDKNNKKKMDEKTSKIENIIFKALESELQEMAIKEFPDADILKLIKNIDQKDKDLK